MGREAGRSATSGVTQVELVAIIGIGVLAVVVLVMLFGPKPRNEAGESEPEKEADEPTVDIFPTGGGH